MNRKEVAEIRKQFTPENCSITRIAGCYVDSEKEKRMEREEAFLSLPEEETFKYFDIFKKTLSGRIGKNLLNLVYESNVKNNGDSEGQEHDLLMRLRKAKLKDPALLDEFYQKIIDSYEYAGNYYIVLIHALYDIPGKSSDGTEMFDASEEIYDFILCSICPVNLSKSGLAYNGKAEKMGERIRDWVVDKPDKGFLFPAFNDRRSDVHSLLYYTKKTSDTQTEMVKDALGIDLVVSSDEEKDKFERLVEDVLGEEPDCNIVKDIYEGVIEEMESHECDAEPYKLDKHDLRKIFQNSDVPSERMELYEESYNRNIGNGPIMASNICSNKNVTIQLPEGKITLDADYIRCLEVKKVDEVKCIVFPVDSVMINGITTKAQV